VLRWCHRQSASQHEEGQWQEGYLWAKPSAAHRRSCDQWRQCPRSPTGHIVASQLATSGTGPDGEPGTYRSDYLGRIIAIRNGDTLIAGPLTGVSDARLGPMLVIGIGTLHHKVAVHPMHPVTVAPEGYRLTVTAAPQPEPQCPDERNEDH